GMTGGQVCAYLYMCVCTRGRQRQAADWTAHLEVLNHSGVSLLRNPHAVGGAAGPAVGVSACRAKVTPHVVSSWCFGLS
ncbi:hypothetical protein XENOCAPTIV_017410, partial [Xenoophorus captivus]